MRWGGEAGVGSLGFTCLWASLSLFFLISLREMESLRNSGSEVPDALNSDPGCQALLGCATASGRQEPTLVGVSSTVLKGV